MTWPVAYKEVTLPYLVHQIPKMVRLDELRLLHDLVRNHVSPDTEIIDAGCFLGGTSVTIAAALADREDGADFIRRVHCYDKFIATSDFYRRFLHDTIEVGDSFLPHFFENTRPYSDYLNVFPGDFRGFKWIGRPIGLFFCDISKSIALEACIWRHFLPSFVPGKTFFVQQDFVHIGAPFVHIVLGCVADHFEFLAVEPPSLLMRYAGSLDVRTANTAIRFYRTASTEEKLKVLERLEEKLLPLGNEEALGSLGLLKAVVCAQEDRRDIGARILADVKDRYGAIEDRYFQVRLEKVDHIYHDPTRLTALSEEETT